MINQTEPSFKAMRSSQISPSVQQHRSINWSILTLHISEPLPTIRLSTNGKKTTFRERCARQPRFHLAPIKKETKEEIKCDVMKECVLNRRSRNVCTGVKNFI